MHKAVRSFLYDIRLIISSLLLFAKNVVGRNDFVRILTADGIMFGEIKYKNIRNLHEREDEIEKTRPKDH